MNARRMFYLMVALTVLAGLSIVGAAYVATGQLHKQSTKLQELKLYNQVLAQEQNGLAKAKKDATKYTPLQKIAQAVVPQDKDQAQAVREIIKMASDSGVSPTSITFPSSTLGSGAVSAIASTTAPKVSTLPTQVTPVVGLPGVYDLQITIQQDATKPVSYTRFIDFLGHLEQNRRTAQVSSITLQPDSRDRDKISFTLIVDEFIKP